MCNFFVQLDLEIVLWNVARTYNHSDFFRYISSDFEMKRKKKKVYLLRKEKKRKRKFNTHPPGIEPEPALYILDFLTDNLVKPDQLIDLLID